MKWRTLIHITCITVKLTLITYSEAKCNLQLGHVEASVNGSCPMKTKWDSSTSCCVPQIHQESDDMYARMQGDSPNECDVIKSQWYPYWDNSCPSGTGLEENTGCCIPCRKCGPGYERNNDCLRPCTPCQQQFYSNQPDHNEHCLQCQRCEDLHRHYKVKCTPLVSSECGHCIEGFVDDQQVDKEVEENRRTASCRALNQDVAVLSERDLSILDEKNRERYNELQRMIIGLFGLFGIAVLVMIIFKLCPYMKRKQRYPKATAEERTLIVQSTDRSSNKNQTILLHDNKEKEIEGKDPEEKEETKPEGRSNGKSPVEETHDQK